MRNYVAPREARALQRAKIHLLVRFRPYLKARKLYKYSRAYNPFLLDQLRVSNFTLPALFD